MTILSNLTTSALHVMSVKIFYGPYEAHGVIRHKTQRLHGVIETLSALGYEIELIPTNYLNIVTVTMRERPIFRCDIRNLMFNVDCEDDIVAQRLVTVVEEAKLRLYADDNTPNWPPITRRTMGKSMIRTQDLFSDDVELIFEIPKSDEGVVTNEKPLIQQ